MRRRQVKRSYNLSMPTDKKIKREDSGIIKKPVKISWTKLVKRYGIYVFLLLILSYIVFFSDIFKISRVDVQGPNKEITQSLEVETNKYIKSLLTNNNWIFLNSEDLKKQLQKTFTGQESIIVKKQFPNKLEVKTDAQKSAIIWKTGKQSYVISVSGRAIGETNDKKTSGSMPTVVDGSNIPVDIGSKVVARDFIDFVMKLDGYFKTNKIAIEQYSVAETTSELNVKINGGYTIRFNTSDSADSQLRSLTATLDLLKSQNKAPLEYLDLRVTGRAFYK